MDASVVLQILDEGARSFTFPALDNGYVYLAGTRLSLFRSDSDWAMVIEVFGYSPRAGLPDLHVHTFGSRLHNRRREDQYVSPEAHRRYLAANPNNESQFFHPIEDGPWIGTEEEVADGTTEVIVRGRAVTPPPTDQYSEAAVMLESPPRVQIYEFCRWLAATHRTEVLGTAEERRVNVMPEMRQLLELVVRR